jgi:ribonuclease HI
MICKSSIFMGKTKNNFFVVWDGKEPGIYESWQSCQRQIHGYAGAKFKGFATRQEAVEAYNSPYWDYVGKNAAAKIKLPVDQEALLTRFGSPLMESIAVDAACSGNPGLMEYRGVYTRTGQEIFRQGPFKHGTNNVGEFLALVHGLALLNKQQSELPIYTDSINAMAWVKSGKARTKLEKTSENEILFELIARAEKWLAENKFSTTILKWQTEAWGEIPADFGRK